MKLNNKISRIKIGANILTNIQVVRNVYKRDILDNYRGGIFEYFRGIEIIDIDTKKINL